MEIRITTLSENTATSYFMAERGLSMLIEADGLKVIFDTGAGMSVAYNAQLMGIDLSSIDRIVLSHGHHDHTGGLYEVLRRAGRKEVIAHPSVWERKYGPPEDKTERYIGIPDVREGLEVLGASFTLSRKPVKLSNSIMTSGEIPVITDYESVDSDLYIKKGEERVPDALLDDLALIIDADFGLVVILGCAHRGIINTLYHAQKLTGKELIYAAIGGTHLLHASGERLAKTAADLKAIGVQYLGVSHCTGFIASAFLAQEFGESFFLNNAGTRFILPF